ncbi:MAG: OmpA family protein [Chlorobi bacterium]|nr:OmpA family protein [Chlorobiota bacterium]
MKGSAWEEQVVYRQKPGSRAPVAVGLAVFLFLFGFSLISQAQPTSRPDTVVQGKRLSIVSASSSNPRKVWISLRTIDISRYPKVSLIIDARDSANHFYQGLHKDDFVIKQDGIPMKIESLETISADNTLPVDIVFVIDQTGSMRQEVNEVKVNVDEFTARLSAKGIDYQLGLVTFSDWVERVRDFTSDVSEFKRWIDGLRIRGGGDDNENALEGIRAAAGLKFRHNSQKIIVLITDAMFHQRGDHGDGKTEFTTASMKAFLRKNFIRLVAITPPKYEAYGELVDASAGWRFNIIEDFSSVLNDFSQSIANLYSATYTMKENIPPESIRLEIRNLDDEVILDEDVPLLEVDKKFVFSNILFDFNKATLKSDYIPELTHVLAMLNAYQTMEIEVVGHTDEIGSDAYNLALSEARALAVKNYLVKQGIAANRIRTRGIGKRYPIASNDTEVGRRLNRRTEIIIMKK